MFCITNHYKPKIIAFSPNIFKISGNICETIFFSYRNFLFPVFFGNILSE